MGGKPFSGKIVLQTFIVMIGNIIGGVLIPLVLLVKQKLLAKTEKEEELQHPEQE